MDYKKIFIEHCTQQNIEKLEIIKKNPQLTISLKRNAIIKCTSEGKLNTLKWLLENNDIRINNKKLLEIGILNKQFEIIEWMYDYFEISIKELNKKILLDAENNLELKNWIKQKMDIENNIIQDLIKICNSNDIIKLNTFFKQNYRYIKTNKISKVFKQCNFKNIDILKWFIENKIIKDQFIQIIFKDQIRNQNLSSCKWLYENFSLNIQNLNLEKFRFTKKNKLFSKWINETVNEEKIFNEFMGLCDSGKIKVIKDFYSQNETNLLKQVKNDKSVFLKKASNNLNLFKWFFNKYNFDKKEVLLEILLTKIQQKNIKLIDYLCLKLTNEDINILNIDSEIVNLCEKYDFQTIDYILSKGFKIKDQLDYIFLIIIMEGELDLAKKLQSEYNYINENNYKYIFLKCCEYSPLNIVKYIYNLKQNPFVDKFSDFYETAIKKSFDMGNKEVIKWLVELFDRYLLIIENLMNIDILKLIDNYELDYNEDNDTSEYDENYEEVNYADLEDVEKPDNEFYNIILENLKNAHELLNITQIYSNSDIEECLICRETPINLLKLNCNHYGCIDCLAEWFKKNDEKCPYCKKNIEWSTCKKIIQ